MPLTEESYKEQLGVALRARRLELGDTQEDVARAIEVPLSVYRGWERATSAPRGAAWFRLCEHFDWPHPLRHTNNLRYHETASDLPGFLLTPSDNGDTVFVDDVYDGALPADNQLQGAVA